MVLPFCVYGQQAFTDTIFDPHIKTVQLHVNGNKLSYPILSLRGRGTLMLRFDDLRNEVKDYYYTIVHCNSEWEKTDMVYSNYINGFKENPIDEYTFSQNTTYNYIHYQLVLPNRDVRFKVSGNYAIKVYSASAPEHPVFIRRFFVEANSVDVNVNIQRPVLTRYMDKKQEIDVTIEGYPSTISDPFNEIKLMIVKNNNWKTAVKNLQPKFVRGNRLIYDYQEKNLLNGGNEFRYFNCKDIDYAPRNVERIDFKRPYYHFYLKTDKDRSFDSYQDQEDINGNYYIQYEDEQESETLADYVYVHFNLPVNAPVIDGDLYVWGAFSLWNCTKENRLTYNYATKSYQTRLLLKQGLYNYEYVLVENDTNVFNSAYMEGSHWQTENDYLIYVYGCPASSRYHQLLRVKQVNSDDFLRK
jgi:hypothetical protein